MNTDLSPKERAEGAYRALSNFVNDMCHDERAFLEAFKRDHRTLQEYIGELCLKVLAECAVDDYGTDARNECIHKIAKKIFDNTKEIQYMIRDIERRKKNGNT